MACGLHNFGAFRGLHIPADGGEIYVMSVMRDTWVDIPGVGEAKINAAFQNGGLRLPGASIEEAIGRLRLASRCAVRRFGAA